MDRPILKQVKALYAHAPCRDRWHVAGRLRLCPFERLAAYVPLTGLIVDLGCGHGVFASALALESSNRRVVGVEPSAHKLAAARATRPRQDNVFLVQGDVLSVPLAQPWRAALLIDVLYLFAREQQEQILRICSERLEPGGVLLLKEMDDRPRWKAALNRFEEWLAVRVLQITWREADFFTFRSLAEWAALCRTLGFETEIVRLDEGYYLPHGAVVGIRR